jgi:hypothetical protein
MKNLNWQIERARRSLQIAQHGRKIRSFLIDEHCSECSARNHLVEEFHPLLTKFYSKRSCACEITARSIETRDKPLLYRVTASDEWGWLTLPPLLAARWVFPLQR